MIRVLHILSTLEVGGTESQAFEILSRLDRSRFEPAVAWLSGPAELGPRFDEAGVRRFDLRSDDPLGAVTFRTTLEVLHSFRPHVVHTHLAAADLVGGAAARLAATPVVLSTRHIEGRSRGIVPFDLADRLVAALPHRIVCVSEAVGRDLARRIGVGPHRLSVLRYGQPQNGAGIGRDPASRSVLRRRLGLPPGTKIVACIARLTTSKGLTDLLRAASLLRDAAPEARFLVAGRGEQRPRLEQAIRDLDLEETVRLLGFRRDVTSILRGSDLLVLPSHLEGFGLVLLEAMETGIPVVGTRVGAIPEVVEDGRTGIIVPPRDPDSLATAILHLMRYPELADRMGSQGRERVRTEFGIERAVREHEALYAELLTGGAEDA